MIKNEGVSGSFTIVKISFGNRKELCSVLSYMSLRLLHEGAVGGRKRVAYVHNTTLGDFQSTFNTNAYYGSFK